MFGKPWDILPIRINASFVHGELVFGGVLQYFHHKAYIIFFNLFRFIYCIEDIYFLFLSVISVYIFFLHHKPVAPIGFMEAKMDGLLARLDFL